MNFDVIFTEAQHVKEEYASRIAILERERDKIVYDMVGSLQTSLEQHITDQSIPLEERFAAWCKAPSELLGFNDYLPSFEDIALGKKFFSMSEFDRREEVDVREVLMDFIDEETGKFDATACYSFEKIETKELEAIVEQFMKLNLGYFNFDW